MKNVHFTDNTQINYKKTCTILKFQSSSLRVKTRFLIHFFRVFKDKYVYFASFFALKKHHWISKASHRRRFWRLSGFPKKQQTDPPLISKKKKTIGLFQKLWMTVQNIILCWCLKWSPKTCQLFGQNDKVYGVKTKTWRGTRIQIRQSQAWKRRRKEKRNVFSALVLLENVKIRKSCWVHR